MDIIILRQVALMAVVAVGLVLCEPPLSTQYGVPDTFARNNGHGTHGDVTNSYGVPLRDSHDINQDYIDNQPKSYEFGYAVKDVATGNDFGRRETSDGETVRGEYRVQLPDGRTQIVTYTADWKTGFHADVRYEGTAVHPEQYNTYNNNGHDYDYHGNNVEASYSTGSNGGYNGYNGGSGNYNSGFSGNDNNNYHFGTNSVDNSYSNFRGLASDSFDSKSPLPTYGTPSFH